MSNQANNKIDAIYELREAVERKVRTEIALDAADTDAGRDALLDATLELEAKTQDAIEVCHECGDRHTEDDCHNSTSVHNRVLSERDNVIEVDFSNQPLERDA